MKNQTAAPLTVYKASAGSGKTFTLAAEYIALLVKKPDAYKETLAVTFTNKATEEMKMRIISKLYGIAHELPDSRDYLNKVAKITGITDKQFIVRQASKALRLLVHHYQDFRVQTIDAFFQSVLRNLAKELDLTANLRISLNDREIEAQAVDEMIEGLKEKDDVLKWIQEYISTNIDDDKSWNVIQQIKDFGMNIFRDFYKKHSDEMDEKLTADDFFREYNRRLVACRKKAEEAITQPARRLLDFLADNQLDDPMLYPYGTRGGIYMYIKKVAEGRFDGAPTGSRVQKAIDEPNSWAKKGSAVANQLVGLAESHLCDALRAVEEARLANWNNYQSAVLTMRHLSQLRLLRAIGHAVRRMNDAANRFPLSNTQMLLNGLMEDSDAPFIFEKIGARLHNIMIDEFQDTSTVQWENFKVLLQSCLGERGSHSLIVGDVKQSIYRWREGDWKLLNNFSDEKPDTPCDWNNHFRQDQVKVETLDTNYRSDKRIIAFNNTFFSEAARIETDTMVDSAGIPENEAAQLTQAYADVAQRTIRTEGHGSVTIRLLPETDYHETMLEETLGAVKEMLDRGIKPKDIAILVRVNKVIPDIAEAFAHDDALKDVRLVSDEAFRLDSSLAVNMLVTSMHLLTHPDDRVAMAQLVSNYHQHVLRDGQDLTRLFLSDAEMATLLPQEYMESREDLLTMPLMDLVDRLYALFSLDRLDRQSAYVCSFYDCMADYLQDNAADIDGFIDQWDNTLHEKTIQSDEINGIRLISIHKSKGLEYRHVIIPFCDWRLELNSTIWCETDEKPAPFNELPVVPVDFSQSAMAGTVYEKDYRQEHLQNMVDNMNLLYVAFTRAARDLVVLGKRAKPKSKSNGNNRSMIVERCLGSLAEKLDGATLEGEDDANEPLVFTFGTMEKAVEEYQNDMPTANVFEIPVETRKINIESFNNQVEFRQSNKSREFVEGDDEPDGAPNSYIRTGNVLHELFSHIRTLDDIDPLLGDLEQSGVIYSDELTAEELRQKITEAMNDVRVRDWFSPRWRLFNECTILETDKTTGEVAQHRPDRVMTDGNEIIVVDFKFGKPNKDYAAQVQRYMRLLADMGYSHISGYLWYVMRHQVVAVGQS